MQLCRSGGVDAKAQTVSITKCVLSVTTTTTNRRGPSTSAPNTQSSPPRWFPPAKPNPLLPIRPNPLVHMHIRGPRRLALGKPKLIVNQQMRQDQLHRHRGKEPARTRRGANARFAGPVLVSWWRAFASSGPRWRSS